MNADGLGTYAGENSANMGLRNFISLQKRIIVMASAILAVILSFFIPGLGQFYTGQFLKAVLLFVAYVIFCGMTLVFFIPIIACLFIWIYSMLDAYNAAKGH